MPESLTGPPRTIIYGTVAASACSAFITSVVSTLRGNIRTAPSLAGTSAFSTGIAASVFFGIREYAVTPVVQGRLEHRLAPSPPLPDDGPSSLSQLSSHKLVDSAVSGMVAGGLLNAWRHGRSSILSGALTAGVFCTALQFAFNKAMVARLRMISDRANGGAVAIPDAPKHSPFFLEGIISSIGFNRMDQGQYLEALKKTRDGHLRKIKELEAEIERDGVQDTPKDK
ncbi:hypothetical protein BDV98DRAFT_599831 [Pterulicium gracile]|uniref:Uncharacterized protein n=1 Tax=Pterulicium gracile TaxID=1884261 RepID=A0A5C3R029_9AGAR|nr:hypothetical protein BDV98DRAFT_599831 [Pterula gracilis]